MFIRAYTGLKRAIAVACIAIACLFCVQSVLISIDRIEHAFEIEHDANPLAGTIYFCAVTSDGACEQPGDVHQPLSHAHHGDATTSVLAGTPPVLMSVGVAEDMIPPATSSLGRGLGPFTPDRPPKAA